MRRLLLLVGAIVFVDTVFFAALTPLLPRYADDLDLSKGEAGLLSAAYPLGALIGGLPSGVLTARVGVKPTVLLGLALMTVTTIVFGFADSYALLVAARAVQGAASSCSWTASFAWLVAAAPADRRGELIGSALGAAIFGALCGPALGAVASAVGTPAAFSSVAVLAFGLAAWAVVTPAFRPNAPQPLSFLFRALGDTRVLVPFWLTLLPALAFGIMGVLAPLDLARLGVGAVAIGAVYVIAAGFEAVLSPIVGRFSDRRGRLLPLRAGLSAGTVLAVLLAWANHSWLIAVLVVLAAMAFGTFWAPALSMLADGAEARGLDHGYGFALMNLAWSPGATIGAAVGGNVAGAITDAVPYLALSALFLTTLLVAR